MLCDSYSHMENKTVGEIISDIEDFGETPSSFSIEGRIIGERIVGFEYSNYNGFCLDYNGNESVSFEMLDDIEEKLETIRIGYNYVSDNVSVEVDEFWIATDIGKYEFVADEKGEL